MFRQKTLDLIQEAVNSEYENATAMYGEKYNSEHEGYAVLKEEIEEARDELTYIENALEFAWNKIKKNERSTSTIANIKITAEKLALEASQIAAVCKKMNLEDKNGSPCGKEIK